MEVSEPGLVGRAWRRKTWLEVMGNGEKMRKACSGPCQQGPCPSAKPWKLFFALQPPPTRPLEEKRSQAAIQPPPGLQEECLVLGGETPGKREGESGGVQ